MTHASLDSSALANITRVIAVIGCQRSGTTLTGQILGAHPQAILIDEFDGLYPWFAARSTEADSEQLARAMLDAAAEKYRKREGRFSRAARGLAVSRDVSVLVLKAPNLTYDDGRLATLGVPVTIVYPVRDPRAVVASMQRLAHVPFVDNQLRLIDARPNIARTDPHVATMRDAAAPMHVRQAAMWTLKSGRADAFVAAGLPVHQFQYEAFIREAATQIDRLVTACALAPAPEVHAPERAYVGIGPGETDRTRAVDTRSLAKWRDGLDDVQQRDVLRVAGPLARRFGYVA